MPQTVSVEVLPANLPDGEIPWNDEATIFVFQSVPLASAYGCGDEGCQDCYPAIYECSSGARYSRPRLNNEAARDAAADCTEDHQHDDEA